MNTFRFGPMVLTGALIGLSPVQAVEVLGSPVPESVIATCEDLAAVTFLSATEHLSRRDRHRLAQAMRDVRKKNGARPAISPMLVHDAFVVGQAAHGGAGPGNFSLDAAREDALGEALYVQRDCLASGGISAGISH